MEEQRKYFERPCINSHPGHTPENIDQCISLSSERDMQGYTEKYKEIQRNTRTYRDIHGNAEIYKDTQ